MANVIPSAVTRTLNQERASRTRYTALRVEIIELIPPEANQSPATIVKVSFPPPLRDASSSMTRLKSSAAAGGRSAKFDSRVVRN